MYHRVETQSEVTYIQNLLIDFVTLCGQRFGNSFYVFNTVRYFFLQISNSFLGLTINI
mgnify:CR=1 FL=1